MMWLWLPIVWLALACVLGLWLGAALRTAQRNDEARCAVERAVDQELVEL